MKLPERYYSEILAHAREGQPNEICGLIAGKDGRAVKLWRTTNNDPNPRVRYNVEPLELLSILREIEDNGWKLAAIYHSHPATDAYPSATDIGLAYYPESVYIIVSLAGSDEPVVRSYRIVDHAVVDEPLELESDGDAEPAIAIAGAGGPPPSRPEKREPRERSRGFIRRIAAAIGWRRPDSEGPQTESK